jgi:DNA-binding LacI/PurR family transcriptional regulator
MILARAPVVAPRLQVSVPSPGAVSLAERRWRDYQARLALSGYPITRRKIHHRLLAYHLTKRYTALIAPNDRVGHWLRSSLGKYEAGGGRGVSLISFDNSLHSRRLPITTVDFGFRDLGYKAFHFLLGDLPVARGHGGDIPAVPYVVDRGSVMHRGGAEARSGPV